MGLRSDKIEAYSIYIEEYSVFSSTLREAFQGIISACQLDHLSIPNKVVILIICAITAPIILAVTVFFFLMWLVAYLTVRLSGMVSSSSDINPGDIQVPTFYSFVPGGEEEFGLSLLLMFVTGVIFGGIHCAGWFFIFPSSDEAILWRVCSVVLTGIAFLLPPLFYLRKVVELKMVYHDGVMVVSFIYVLSRLLLLVEAFASLRRLVPGMLSIVKWTTFIPHI